MSTHAVDLGRFGEELAAEALSELGWDILARNWRCEHGEIDVVAFDGVEAVVVEVKTRRHRGFGAPAEAVTRAKLARLRRLACAWLAAQPRRFAGVRIDVIAIDAAPDRPPQIEHLRGVG